MMKMHHQHIKHEIEELNVRLTVLTDDIIYDLDRDCDVTTLTQRLESIEKELKDKLDELEKFELENAEYLI